MTHDWLLSVINVGLPWLADDYVEALCETIDVFSRLPSKDMKR
jgi:hypothetical protein